MDQNSDEDHQSDINNGVEPGETVNSETETEELPTKRRKFSDLTSAQRRYCLIECAKLALHYATYRENIRKSFKTTGIYPLSVEQALKREGVREAPDMDIYRENIAISKKRKRESINGIHLNRQSSIDRLKRIEQEAADKSQPKAKRAKR